MIWKRGPKETRRITRCVCCQRVVPVRNTIITGEGLLCDDCERARVLRELEPTGSRDSRLETR